jgi:hypothetical protein
MTNPDWMTLAGAARLAARIEAYWRQQGHDGRATVVAEGEINNTPVYSVRTNLVDGMPQP